MIIISARRDFLAANAGRRAPTPGFLLLVRDRLDADPQMRAGFTVTKKIGNSVVRNRLKRRLRALVRQVLPEAGITGADHVLIGRDAALIASAIGSDGAVPQSFAASMEEAVQLANTKAHAGDAVLMSPACASFDQFRDYEVRGDSFREIVAGLTAR